MNKKFKSFKKLLEKSDINPNQRNKDGTTTYGVLFYHSQTQFYIDEGYQPKENMEFLIQTCQKETFKNKININKTSIDILQSGQINTPIYSYFKRRYDKITLQDNKVEFDKQDLKLFFGDLDLNFKENREYFEFIGLFFVPSI